MFPLFFCQLIAELQTSACDSKEEAVRLKQAMEKQLKEANARWDKERQAITHEAEQANKVCAGSFVAVVSDLEMSQSGYFLTNEMK